MSNPERRRHPALRVLAVCQGILAGVAVVGVLAFLPGGGTLGGDGIMEGFRWSFVGAFAVAATGAGYGAVRTWREARLWWLPLLAALIAAPVLFVLLAR